MSDRFLDLFSQGQGHGVNIIPHLGYLDKAAMHSSGLDKEFNRQLRETKHDMENVVLYHHKGGPRQYTYTVPIHIKKQVAKGSRDVGKGQIVYNFHSLVQKIMKDPMAFADRFLKAISPSAYLTHLEIVSDMDDKDDIYTINMSFVTKISQEDLDEGWHNEPQMVIYERIERMIKKSKQSRDDILYDYDVWVDYTEILEEEEDATLGKKKRSTRKHGKRSNPKKRKSCKKANMIWVGKHKSKSSKGKRISVRGSCKKHKK